MRKRLVSSVCASIWVCSGQLIVAGCGGVAGEPERGELAAAFGQQSSALRAQPVEPPDPPEPEEKQPIGKGGTGGLATEDEGSGQGGRCLCIAISEPPASCTFATWFCSVTGECFCDGPAVPQASGAGAVATLAQRRSASAAPSLDELQLVAADPDPGAQQAPILSDLPGCICGFGTATVPAGDCAEENWYCNRSGLCRCAI